MRLSLTNKIMVNATVVIAEIAGYPALWQLHNETLGLHLAKPIDDKHLVYIREHSVLRLEEASRGGRATNTPRAPEKTLLEIPPMLK